MANRYWVGGDGTWDASDTTHWSASSGGAGGASVPASTDAVLFDAASGGGTCAFGLPVSCLTFTINGYTGTFASAGHELSITGSGVTVYSSNATHTLSGDLTVNLTYAGATGTRTITSGNTTEAHSTNFKISAGTDTVSGPATAKDVDFSGFSGTWGFASTRTWYGSAVFSLTMTLSAGTAVLTLASTNATARTITCNGQTLDFPVTLNGAGGTFRCADAFTLGATRALTLTNGTLDGNGHAVSIGSFALGAGTKTLTMGGGTWTVALGWNAATNVANLTVTPAGTIDMTSGSAKTFAGGGKAWPTLNQGGAGALTISGSNTFADITATTLPSTISFTDGTTQTVDRFTARGQPGALLTLGPTGAGTWSIGKAGGGPVNLDYLSVSKSIALYRDWFAGRNSTDGGGNTGWRFTPYSSLIPLILPRRR